jgi:signal transduction histidine kinase
MNKTSFSLSTKFIIGCGLTLTIALALSFYILGRQQEKLIMGQVENKARAIFKQIIITRKWIADHGGVFVEKLPWVKPSPFMENSEVKDIKGKQYVKNTPAMVTKELSKYARDRESYWFHITSLKLTNPDNAPDSFEKKSLVDFEQNKADEIMSVEKIDNSHYLRYISPLYIEDACLSCHAKQGYKIGDVRGAISITIPLDKTFEQIAENKRNMCIAAIFSLISLMGAMLFMMNNLVLIPVSKLKASMNSFSEGKKPPINTLKTGDEFEDLFTSFANMAGTLSEYHNCLNDKIQIAVQDVEETNKKLVEVNRKLNEANIRKSDFIAGASHELRTPLTSIKGAMDYISLRLSSISKQSDDYAVEDLNVFFEVIKKNSDRLIRMVNNMLDIERIEMGVSELHFTLSDMSRLISETAAGFKPAADDKKIDITMNIPYSLPVCIDDDRIRQVMTNLLSNALKFSPQGSSIIINAFADKEWITVEVLDSGCGIPLDEREKIFIKFYKGLHKEGTGLGLAICKSIIEAHKGEIGVKSNSDGKGSVFYFRLPAVVCNSDASCKDYVSLLSEVSLPDNVINKSYGKACDG